jgi:D-alanyl-D-alanine dipeptidase
VIGQYTGIAKDSLTAKLFPEVIVRKGVKEKLEDALAELRKINPDYQLVVAWGYRDLEDQQALFKQEYDSLKDSFDNEADLLEAVHMKVAVPNASGHPTGGAADVTVYNRKTGEYLDFGSDVFDFSVGRIIYFDSPEVSAAVKENRRMLREAMLKVGFAPYDGEWWHYSYGDKEWAFYYQNETLYNQIYARDIHLEE